MDTFNPSVTPQTSGTNRTSSAAVNTAQFGDGYSQRARDGINSISRSLVLNWDYLTFDEAADLDSFFESHGGDEAFLYWVAGDSAQRMWTCAGWRNGYEYGVGGSYSATLKEVFDIVS
jgi:phage-related protein